MNSDNTDAGGSKKAPAMEWMYKPTALVNREDYLLGRTVDKSLKMLDEAEKGNAFSYADEVEKDRTPISIFAKPTGQAGPVDIIKKIKEDPLYQIHKKEEENLKQLLKNPVRMKQLRELADLRESGTSSTAPSTSSSKDKSKKRSKHKKHSKKKKRKSSSSEDSSSEDSSDGDVVKSAKAVSSFEDLDKLLSAKINSLKDKSKGKHKEDSKSKHVADPVPDRSSDERSRDHRRDPLPYSDRHRLERDREPYHRDRDRNHNREERRGHPNHSHADRDRERGQRRGFRERSRSRTRSRSPRRPRSPRREPERASTAVSASTHRKPERKTLDEEELERKRREMMENAKWRDDQRTKNVTKYREEQQKEEEKNKKELDPDFIRKQLMEAATTGSVEKRIKSNSYNIQKSKSAMNLNFARR